MLCNRAFQIWSTTQNQRLQSRTLCYECVPLPPFCWGGGRAAGDGCCDGGSCFCSSGVSVVAVCFPTAQHNATNAEECTQETPAAGWTAKPARNRRRRRRRREEDVVAVSERRVGAAARKSQRSPQKSTTNTHREVVCICKTEQESQHHTSRMSCNAVGHEAKLKLKLNLCKPKADETHKWLNNKTFYMQEFGEFGISTGSVTGVF